MEIDHNLTYTLKEIESKGGYLTLIDKIKEEISKDIYILANPYVKSWLGKRWRNLFIRELSNDAQAIKVATKKKLFGRDNRSIKEKVTFRFLRGDGLEEWSLDLPEAEFKKITNTTMIFCPGLLNDLLPLKAFQKEFPSVRKKFGLRIVQTDSHPMRSCDANVEDILNTLEKGLGIDEFGSEIAPETASPPDSIFILSYSKGTADLLHCLVKHPHLKSKIKCIINLAGAPGGSYLANNLYEFFKDFEIPFDGDITKFLKMISPVIQVKSPPRRNSDFDIKGALRDLTTQIRSEFMDKNSELLNNLGIPIFNITGSTTPMEVPYFQLQGILELNQYDANNDMQVIQKHAKIQIPMATDLGMVHAHHWDMSYNSFPKNMRFGSPNLDHPFPKEAMLTAICKFLTEIGLVN